MNRRFDKMIKSKQHAKRCGNLRQLAEFTKILGDMYFADEQHNKALQEYMEQVSICEDLQDNLNCAIAHRMIADVYANLGNYEQALIHQNLHLDGARNLKNVIEEQRAFTNLGRIYLCLSESLSNQSQKRDETLASAKTAFAKSMELCDKLTDSEIKLEEKMLMRARLHLNLGLTLEMQKDTQQAIDLLEQATALCVSNNFQEDLYRACISLAAIYEQQGNYELALNYIETATSVNDICLKAEAKLSKVELFMRTGQWIESRKILVSLYKSSGLSKNINHQIEKYLKIIITLCQAESNLLVETDIWSKQKLYETLGDAAVAVRCFNKGIEYYQHMLACAEETGNQIGNALISLAKTFKDTGRYKEALSFARREFKLCIDSREKCRSALFLLDLLIATNATDTEIQEYYILAMNSANENSDAKLQRSVTKQYIRYLEKEGNFEEAKDIAQKAELTSKALSDTESEASYEESEIGANICLEDLSDLEAEETVKKAFVIRSKGKKTNAVKRNAKGETQLHVACINGDICAVEKLLSSGHSINVRDYCGWSPLHEAANHGYIDIAKLLLKHGANINDPGGASCKGVTPLHDAACCGHFSMMQLLMQYGANVALKTYDGDTVLDYLEDWRDRVGDLNPEDLVEYEIMYKKLSSIISMKKKKKKFDVQALDMGQPEIQQISAGEDYKRTIANLRSFNKIKSVAVFKNNKDAVTPLISEEQIFADDWLEDDIGSTVKKKIKLNNHITKRKSAEGNIENTSKKLKLQDTFQSEDLNTDEDTNDNTDAEVTQLLEEPKRIKRKRQVSLLSNGFTMSHTSSPITDLQSSLHTFKQYSEEYINVQIFVKEKLFNVKVNICEDEKKFLICITTILEHMFFNETGCIVKLLLQPINGNIVTKENILKISRENVNEKLECEIVELQVPPIIERYKTICCSYNIIPCEIILKCLKSCENTSVFCPKSENMDKKLLISLLKTLEYQSDIKLLQLSNTVLLTTGTYLHQCLSNLSSLQELYLKSCDIDFACLCEISSLPPQLRVLDLSYNPLSSKSCEILRKLLAPLKYLQTLNLRYCELEDFCPPLDIPNLTSCDISWNKLNCNITSFLSRQLFDLNLSNTLCFSNQFTLDETSIVLSSIESLELSFCDLTDSDVKIILACLPRLSKLVLSGNVNVSVLSINILLSHHPTLTYINVSGCKSIASVPEAELVIQNPRICTLFASIESELCESWIKLWRGVGIVTKLPHNLAIFKPI